MAFLTGSVQLNVYTDASQTSYPLLNVPNVNYQFTNNSVTGFEDLYFNLAALASQTISFNSMTGVTEFLLYSDTTALTVAINGGSAIAFKAATPGYIPLAATALVITNASASTATNVMLKLIKG